MRGAKQSMMNEENKSEQRLSKLYSSVFELIEKRNK